MTEERTTQFDVSGPLGTLLGEADTAKIFSEPEEIGDSLIITASAWERGGGFGSGSGYGSGEGESGGGSGGGGGGASQGRPVAVIRATADSLEVQPVIDFTKIGVTLLFGLAGWLSVRKRLAD